MVVYTVTITPSTRHGDMENASRFPHPHTPGGYDGQMSNKALH
jgi:hypothetical protein